MYKTSLESSKLLNTSEIPTHTTADIETPKNFLFDFKSSVLATVGALSLFSLYSFANTQEAMLHNY